MHIKMCLWLKIIIYFEIIDLILIKCIRSTQPIKNEKYHNKLNEKIIHIGDNYFQVDGNNNDDNDDNEDNIAKSVLETSK